MLFDMATRKDMCCYFYFLDEKVKAKRAQVSRPLNIASKCYSYYNKSLSDFKYTHFYHL